MAELRKIHWSVELTYFQMRLVSNNVKFLRTYRALLNLISSYYFQVNIHLGQEVLLLQPLLGDHAHPNDKKQDAAKVVSLKTQTKSYTFFVPSCEMNISQIINLSSFQQRKSGP